MDAVHTEARADDVFFDRTKIPSATPLSRVIYSSTLSSSISSSTISYPSFHRFLSQRLLFHPFSSPQRDVYHRRQTFRVSCLGAGRECVHVQFREEAYSANDVQNLTGRFYTGPQPLQSSETPAFQNVDILRVLPLGFLLFLSSSLLK